MKTKFIFITGGVVSSLGKGLASASLAALLQSRGYKVRLRKLDPYLNVDPGTMNPMQHGEVFVTEDGAETDLDLGHYERFTGVDAKKTDNVTSGQIYKKLLAKERKGDYLGGTVQVIPHVTDLIKEFILNDLNDIDFALCEIGGTVGDIEALPFFESIRQLTFSMGKERCLLMHLTFLPYISAAGELKTKPTQHSVKELRSIGLQPDILLCRSEHYIDESKIHKMAQMCSVAQEYVIRAPDVKNIYEVPYSYHCNKLDERVIEFFKLENNEIDLNHWKKISQNIKESQKNITIAIVGKYNDYKDSYKSIIESIDHAAIELGVRIEINWINAREFSENEIDLKKIDGFLVPGAFGEDGSLGKIDVIKYSRENKIPFLGICYGMQMAVIEYARNILNIKNATSGEFSDEGEKVIDIIEQWDQDGKTIKKSKNIGGTMRLGSYPCKIKEDSLAYKIYKKDLIHERHRHRYEVDISYKEQFEANGMIFSGISPDGKLPEIVEIKNHPFFLATQYHPELKSRPFKTHPIFLNFIKESINQNEKNN
jgi:CTP synthase